jgi:hypothetical protein
MHHHESYSLPSPRRAAWNKGKLMGAKPPLRPKHVWSIRTKLQVEGRTRDLAMFNVAIDSKLRGCVCSLEFRSRICRIDQPTDNLRARDQLTQQLQPLRPECVDQKSHSRDIAAGAVETETRPSLPDRVGADHENDRNGSGCSFGCHRSLRAQRNIRSPSLNLPVDLAPVQRDVDNIKWASNTTLDDGSNLYVANRGNNTIVRMRQDGSVVAVRRVSVDNGPLNNASLNGIATSPDGTTIYVKPVNRC